MVPLLISIILLTTSTWHDRLRAKRQHQAQIHSIRTGEPLPTDLGTGRPLSDIPLMMAAIATVAALFLILATKSGSDDIPLDVSTAVMIPFSILIYMPPTLVDVLAVQRRKWPAIAVAILAVLLSMAVLGWNNDANSPHGYPPLLESIIVLIAASKIRPLRTPSPATAPRT